MTRLPFSRRTQGFQPKFDVEAHREGVPAVHAYWPRWRDARRLAAERRHGPSEEEMSGLIKEALIPKLPGVRLTRYQVAAWIQSIPKNVE